MKIDQQNIDHIKASFEKMNSKNDFLNLLNYAKPLVYGEKTQLFSLNQIKYYSNPVPNPFATKRYNEFKIKKKSGADRIINAPNRGLKAIQKTLSFILQCVFEPHKAAFGFVRDKSIVENANLHVGKNYVYNIDLKDFFSSIDQARVWKCLHLVPFNLNDSASEKLPKKHTFLEAFTNLDGKEKRRQGIANIIASICCTEMHVERKNEKGEWTLVKKNVLPQGAPTSPVITNIVCQKLDYLLTGVAKRFNLKYSRYADDITFSSMHSVYNADSDFQKELSRIIIEQGFHIKETKTRLQKQGYRQEVTGLIVNENVNVPQRYIKQLRMWLYLWESYGYEKAYSFFLKDYVSDKGHTKSGKPDIANVLGGKLDYLKMVKGGENPMYLILKGRFEKLVGTKNSINSILDLWESEGIEKAMEVYYNFK